MGVCPTWAGFTIGVGFFHRNAFWTDACEEWTVPHTVPLRGGALQTDACADCL